MAAPPSSMTQRTRQGWRGSLCRFSVPLLPNTQVPEIFLRGAGVPDNLITYIGSLVGKTIEFYLCFIATPHKIRSLPTSYTPLPASPIRTFAHP